MKTFSEQVNRRMTTKSIFICIVLLILLPHTISAQAVDDRSLSRKQGILIVTSGSTSPIIRAAFGRIENNVRMTFPETPIRWAYTDGAVRDAFARKAQPVDSVEIALSRMLDEGLTHVVLQSTEIVPGLEFHRLVKTAHAFGEIPSGFEKIIVTFPLLAATGDIERLAEAIIRHFPKDKHKGDALVLVGRGANHPSHTLYTGLEYRLRQYDENIFIEPAGQSSDIEALKTKLVLKGIQRAYWMPFTSMVKEEPGGETPSWTSVLREAGIECIPVAEGLVEFEDVIELWLDHLKKAYSDIE